MGMSKRSKAGLVVIVGGVIVGGAVWLAMLPFETIMPLVAFAIGWHISKFL